MDSSQQLREEVRRVYSAAAENPQAKHPFPVGRQFAESLGYPRDWLEQLPPAALDAFAGVSNVSIFAELPAGATVLDLGCGAGLDSLIAARRVGRTGRVIAVDFSASMLERARSAAREAGLDNVEFYQAAAEHLPIHDDAIDVALVNGIFNLNPAREKIFLELARVLRRGGELFGAELILRMPLPERVKRSKSNWFA